jgi:hypothetical protein
MAIHVVNENHIERFWDDKFKTIEYVNEPFNDPESVELWTTQGYSSDRICGDLADMRHRLPRWIDKFIDIYEERGWKDIGIAFYRMRTGTIMPVHKDLYKRYIELFNLQGRENTIRRALLFLEDWHPGHYLEVNGRAYVHWCAGDVVEWVYDTPHMAANIGLQDRYTLQITGHI